VLVIAAASGLLTTLFAGTLPALIVTRPQRARTLQTGAHRSSSRHGLLSKLLIPVQVALGLLLVTIAGLFVASLARLLIAGSGIRDQGVFMGRTKLEWRTDRIEQLDALYARMLEHLSALPGVRSASLVLHEPMTHSADSGHFISHDSSGAVHEDNFENVVVNAVGPGFFETLGIPMLAGRDFAVTDTAHSPGVCILSESAAGFFFPAGPAIGGYLESPSDVARAQAASYQVVAIVGDAKYKTLHEDAPPTVYIPYPQQTESVSPAADTPSPHSDLSFVIRGTDPSLLSSAYRKTLHEFVPAAPVFDLVSLLALLLTCISLYGQVAWNVTERTSEIGIRMALGATRANVVRMICGGLAAPIVIGMVSGLSGAIAVSRLLASLLYETRPADPRLLLCSLGAMFLAAVLASYRPARRAASIDPMQCLRTD
jgi:predicted permease